MTNRHKSTLQKLQDINDALDNMFEVIHEQLKNPLQSDIEFPEVNRKLLVDSGFIEYN